MNSPAAHDAEIARKIIPIIGTYAQFARILEREAVTTVLLRHCNPFEIAPLLELAHHKGLTIYANIDQIAGIHADAEGIAYLSKQLHVSGIISNHMRVLEIGKSVDIKTIQRIFAVDSAGLEATLKTIDTQMIDMLDIAPALVIPHLTMKIPLPFIASGLITTPSHLLTVLRTQAQGVAVSQPGLWP